MRKLENENLPDPWLYDTDALLRDLDFIRELVLKIPASQATYLPTNTAIEALWDLRERLRFLAVLRLQGQRRWEKGAGARAAGGAKKKAVLRVASGSGG